MNDLLRFVDPTIPGLGGPDLVRLAQLKPHGAETVSRDVRERRDLGLDRGGC